MYSFATELFASRGDVNAEIPYSRLMNALIAPLLLRVLNGPARSRYYTFLCVFLTFFL